MPALIYPTLNEAEHVNHGAEDRRTCHCGRSHALQVTVLRSRFAVKQSLWKEKANLVDRPTSAHSRSTTHHGRRCGHRPQAGGAHGVLHLQGSQRRADL